MKNSLQNVVVVFMLLCSCTMAQAQQINVHTNGYKGWITTSSAPKFYLHNDTTLTILPDKEGHSYINTGAAIGDCSYPQTSYIYLYFNSAGLIDSLCPAISATRGEDKKSITLQTASMTIEPGRFNREWTPSWGTESGGSRGAYRGRKTVMLIEGQTYNISTNPSGYGLYANCKCDPKGGNLTSDGYYGSEFYFTVQQNGHVQLYERNAVAAEAYGRKVRFKTTRVKLDPAEISEGAALHLTLASGSMTITKKTKLPFVRGVSNHVDWTTPAGKAKSFYFLPM